MAENFPGPYEMRFFYEAAGFAISHVARISVNLAADPTPGDLFSAISCLNWDASNQSAAATAEGLLALIAPLYHTSVTFNLVELWKYVAGTYDSTFVSAYSPVTTTAGTNGSGVVPSQQAIMTFRTTGGGILRFTLMEPSLTGSTKAAYPTGTTAINNLMAYIASDSQPFNARDNTRPFAPLRYLPGQNEHLWRLINRP